MLILSLTFVSSCLPCLSPFFDFYLPVLYYSYFFLVCISLPISSVSFLIFLSVSLPRFSSFLPTLSFLPLFLLSFRLPTYCRVSFFHNIFLSLSCISFFFTFCPFLLHTTSQNHIPTFFPLIIYTWQSD